MSDSSLNELLKIQEELNALIEKLSPGGEGTEGTEGNPTPSDSNPTVQPWMLFLFFLIAFIAFDFWAEAGRMFVEQHLHKGKEISWHRMALYAFIITIIFVVIIYFAGVPIATFEDV